MHRIVRGVKGFHYFSAGARALNRTVRSLDILAYRAHKVNIPDNCHGTRRNLSF